MRDDLFIIPSLKSCLRNQLTSTENRRGTIERRFAFMNGTLGLDLVNTRTAESLAVKIDVAIVLSNVLTLLRVFAIPILILAKFEGEAYQIRYKFTTSVEDMVA
ncbi:transposase [Lacticaseibacillus rhamnosus]|nr:transposase [Lacticaseibacillus rhamnosus]